jgi:MFS family permease
MSLMTATTLAEPAPAAPPQPPAALGAAFLRVWFGQAVSTIGSTVSGMGVAVYVYLTTGSAVWLGVLEAVAVLPVLLVGPLLPRVDRVSRRSAMLFGDTLAAAGPVGALALSLLGHLEVWHLVVASFVGGVGTALQVPAASAAIPTLVPAAALGRANGLSQMGEAAGLVLGPAIATPLVAIYGIRSVLIVDLVTFLVAVVATLTTKFPSAATPAPGIDDDGTWRSATTWLRGEGRPLVALIVAMAIVNFSLSFFNLAAVALAVDLGGARRAGLVIAAAGFCMLAGSIWVARRGVGQRRIRSLASGTAVFAIGCAIAAARPLFGLLVIGVVVAVARVPLVNAAVATIFHERVPQSMQGRVSGLRRAVSMSLNPLGAVTAGLVVAHLAAPAMAPGGALAGTVGPVIGQGAERGAALVLMFVGVALAALTVWLRISRRLAPLDEPVS